MSLPRLQSPPDPPVRILILEDVSADAELVEFALARARIVFESRRVETRIDFLRELAAFCPDLVLADYRLPRFNALEALRLLRGQGLHTPFILVTGSQTEEVAVECMKAGADDYILKSSLTRLPSAVLNALGKRAAERGRQDAEQALRRREEEYRLIAHNTRDLVCRLDGEGVFLYASPSFRNAVGRTPEELLGVPILALVHSEDHEAVQAALRRALADDAEQRVELRYQPAAGEPRLFESVISPVREDDGPPTSAVGVSRDVTDRNRMQEALRVSEERYALAVRGANDGVWDWDLRRSLAYFSPRWKAMLGFDNHEIGNRIEEWLDRVEPAHLDEVKRAVAHHLEGLTPHFQSEHRVRHKDGHYRWMLSRGVAVRDASDRPYRMAGSQTDVTSRKQAEEELLRQALHDPLTGLANRTLFMNHLRHATRRARGDGYRFAVLFLDLDQFKVVNDGLGHLLGDQLLVAAARRLRGCVGPRDLVARMGGDEFTVLLEDAGGMEEATRVADRIQDELRHSFDLDGHEVFTSASIGIALGSQAAEAPEHILRDADTALFRAKSLGRGRYQVFDRRMHEQALARLQLDTELRRALERNEFRVHYQPIVSLGSGRIAGFEALARWEHPSRGLLPAEAFISVTEDNGLIVPLGLRILRDACRQAHEWQGCFPAQSPLSMSVNLSARQFTRPDLIEQVDLALAKAELEAPSLALEITESVVMDNPATAARLLSELKDRRVQLNVDDFGTGYSSLSYLHRFPLDALKIDASFVSRIGRDDDSAEIVRTITTLAHNLGMRVTAEGIEGPEQLRHLRELDCESGQGFYFAAALAADQAGELLASQPHW